MSVSPLPKNLPESPGVYIMRGPKGEILYIGKAANLKRRVSSYFARSHEIRIEKLISEIKKIEIQKTDTALEALLLESSLIKKNQPLYNILEKDDKSFLSLVVTREKFPRVIMERKKNETPLAKKPLAQFGPFISATELRIALKILRRIFPWGEHAEGNSLQVTHSTSSTSSPQASSRQAGKSINSEPQRGCFNYEIGLCPGTCIGVISQKEYMKNIRNFILFFRGEKKAILRSLKKEMTSASKAQEFEKALIIRRQLFALQHIQDSALISESNFLVPSPYNLVPIRIEGYDISNISGTSAVGSMVVFTNGKPDKNEYRKFRIKTIEGPNDVGMLQEVLRRRLDNSWPLPHLFLIDGGRPQVNTAIKVLKEFKLDIPVVGIAKGPERKKNEFIGAIPYRIDPQTLIKVRDEAHRFAITYHRTLHRNTAFL